MIYPMVQFPMTLTDP